MSDMPLPAGMPSRRFGVGRQKGTLNRDRQRLRDLIKEELIRHGYLDEGDEFDAVVMLAIIGMKAYKGFGDQEPDLHLAAKAMAEVAKYTRPQLRALMVHNTSD